MKATYRYSFKNLADTLWYYMQGDTLMTSVTPRYFVDDSGAQMVSPVEWNKTGVGYTRGDGHGVFAKFSLPLNFTYHAERILQAIYTHEGYDGSVIFIVEYIANPEIQVYSEFFKSEIDLSLLHTVRTSEEKYTTANVREKGLVQLMQNNSNQTYNVPLDGDAVTVNQDGVRTSIEYRIGFNYMILDKTPAIAYVPMVEIKHIALRDAFIINTGGFGNIRANTNAEDNRRNNAQFIPLMDIPDGKMRFTIKGGLFNESGGQTIRYRFTMVIFRANDLVTPVYNNPIYLSPATSPSTTVTFDTVFDIYFNFQAGDYVLIYADGIDNATGSNTTNNYDIVIYSGSEVVITGGIRSIAFDMKSLRYPVFLDKFFKIAFGSTVNLVSNFFTADPSLPRLYGNDPRFVSLTSAMEVKGLNRNALRVTWDDIKQDLRKWGLGWAAEGGNIRIEPASYFYRPSHVAYKFPDYDTLDVTIDTDSIFSRLQIGYDNVDTEITGGVYDYNGMSEYAMPVQSIKKNEDWVSPFIASPFSIQDAIYYRFENQETKDTEQDDKIYLMSLDPTPVGGKYNLYRPSGSFTGIPYAETFYNFDITPARCIRFNAPAILTSMAGKDLPTTILRFAKSEKFTQLLSLFSAPESIYEAADIVLEEFATKGDNTDPNFMLFWPAIIKITAVVPDNLLAIMEANAQNRYGVFQFEKDGAVFGIHITEIVLMKGEKELYQVTGKCARNNDIYKLLK